MYVLVWWLVNRARYGEVAGTSLAYRTVSDQKVNWVQGSGEEWATIRRRMGWWPCIRPIFSAAHRGGDAPFVSWWCWLRRN